MTAPAATARSAPDLTNLGIDLRHRHRLAAFERGLEEWHIRILDGEREVGSLHAARCLHYGADNLAERMTDHGGLCALAAGRLLTPDGGFAPELEEAVEQPGSLLVLDRLDLFAPFDDQSVATAVVAEVIDRLTDTYFAVVLPRTKPDADPGTRLLAQAATDLAAEPFDDELQLIDTCLAASEHAAARARASFLSRVQHPHWHLDEEEWPQEEDEGVLTARTAAVLRLAGQELSALAWQEIAALGDEPLPRGAGGVFGRLPAITLRCDGQWRRQMARAFDDLAGDLQAAGEAWTGPRCTGEEMALHLMIDRARSITANRPNAVRDLVAGLPHSHADYDWHGCSSDLFEDHDVLMLFDARLDGIEDAGSDIHQAMGIVNLAPGEWFEPFQTDHARDPGRGYRL
ncbi:MULTISPECIES: hypothetical protein [unclassified Streptomyces]|uniref:hypothetical protein n=1 Tax=unclassified Streptomyces TaxID=2593676 RepID=UPI00068CD277|nr:MULTISPECIES: hypothetical protein [unclassified Streptomyces]KOV94596.1 hypothetical protein ADL02_09750 [Streptomyces sp. NRRL WC-3723]